VSIKRQLIVFLFLSMALSENHLSAEAPDEKVLYRKAISEGQEIVVIQGPQISEATAKSLVRPEDTAGTNGGFSLSVVLRVDGKPPVPVWSRLFFSGQMWDFGDVEVLDLLVLPGRLVMATSHRKCIIDIDQIGLGQPDRRTALPSNWGLVQAFIPPPGTQLSGKLFYDAKKDQVEIEVVETIEGRKQQTVYRQQDEEWRFLRVKQLPERGPTTKPATRE
jgi:hypothetical protein